MVNILQGLSPMGQFDKELSTGIGSGLEALAQQKLKSIMQQKQEQALQDAGVDPNVAKLFTAFPDMQKELLNRIEAKKGSGLGLTQQQQLAQEKELNRRREKVMPEYQYLEDLSDVVDRLIDLNDDPELNFGLSSGVLSKASGVGGRQLMNEKTGEYDTLANKFVTDALQKAKGVRSQYLAKIYENAKPSLGNTREQNERILKFYRESLDKNKDRFHKDNPEFLNDKISVQERETLNHSGGVEDKETISLKESVESPSKPIIKQYKGRTVEILGKNPDGSIQARDQITKQEFKIPRSA